MKDLFAIGGYISILLPEPCPKSTWICLRPTTWFDYTSLI